MRRLRESTTLSMAPASMAANAAATRAFQARMASVLSGTVPPRSAVLAGDAASSFSQRTMAPLHSRIDVVKVTR